MERGREKGISVFGAELSGRRARGAPHRPPPPAAEYARPRSRPQSLKDRASRRISVSRHGEYPSRATANIRVAPRRISESHHGEYPSRTTANIRVARRARTGRCRRRARFRPRGPPSRSTRTTRKSPSRYMEREREREGGRERERERESPFHGVSRSADTWNAGGTLQPVDEARAARPAQCARNCFRFSAFSISLARCGGRGRRGVSGRSMEHRDAGFKRCSNRRRDTPGWPCVLRRLGLGFRVWGQGFGVWGLGFGLRAGPAAVRRTRAKTCFTPARRLCAARPV